MAYRTIKRLKLYRKYNLNCHCYIYSYNLKNIKGATYEKNQKTF